MSGENMLLYLKGERTLEDLKRERIEVRQALRERNRHLLDGKDLDLLEMVYDNADLLKPNLSELSRRTGVPVSSLFDRWNRLMAKRVRLLLLVQPVRRYSLGGDGGFADSLVRFSQ